MDMTDHPHPLNDEVDPLKQYVMFMHDEPEGLLLGDVVYEWRRGAPEPDMTKEVGRFHGTVLMMGGRRAGRRTGLVVSMFDGREFFLDERDLHNE